MLRRLLIVATALGVVSGQDGQLINVKQIMRDAFDIIRNVPPPAGFNEASKVLLSTTPPPPRPLAPAYQSYPPLSPQEYQALQIAQSNQPLTTEQRITLYNLHQRINNQQRYAQQQQPGGYGNNYYQKTYPTTQAPLVNTMNRIFAAPTEKDMERLLRLPADILYKLAEEGKYIDPEDDSQGYSHSRSMAEINQPAPVKPSFSSSSSGSSDNGPSLFGNGFSFNLQGGDSNSAGPINNPFLTKEEVKKEEPTTTKAPKTEEIESKEKSSKEEKPSSETKPSKEEKKEIAYQNLGGEKVDKSKPYFVVNNGEWQLVVPQMDNKPALQIPVKDFTKLTEAVARASVRSGMPVDMTKMMSAEEIHVKPAEIPSTIAPLATTTASTLPTKTVKTPTSAFVQEAESLKSEEEVKTPAPPKEKHNKEATEEEIVLNGKRYKLVNDDKPKKKATKKTKKAKNAGKIAAKNPTVAPTTPAPATPVPINTPIVNPYANLPTVNQPFMPANLGQIQQQPLTFEQQQILAELQRRYLATQGMVMQPQSQQPQAGGPPIYVLSNPDAYNPPQAPNTPVAQFGPQFQQPYYEKLNNSPQVPAMVAQASRGIATMPIKVQPPVLSLPQKAQAAAAPTQVLKNNPASIDPNQPILPKQKQYSLLELDQFYNQQHPEGDVETSKPATTDKVFAPHKQIKIRPTSNTETPIDSDIPTKTTVVDATADSADNEKKRIADLRRRFALERQQLSRRNKARFEKTTNLEPTTPPSFIVTEQHCYNIKNFARQAGSSNVYDYAVSHCHYIENYYPDLKCANVEDYIKVCQQYYSTRRMLFT